jgi:UDP:flavonoid glycosyltransferase YjiC (YdhE family)
LPHGRDQGDTSVRVSALGAGVTLSRSARPVAIARAVRLVIQEVSYRKAAQRLGDILRRDAASDALMHELEEVAGRTDCKPQSDLRRIS